MAKYSKTDVREATERLLGLLKPGMTIYCVLKHVSRSGMSREISLYVIQDGAPQWISWAASRVLEERLGKRDGIIVGGCGMDMGFPLVYNLSRTLFRGGFGCIGEKPLLCLSNDHSNGDRDYTSHVECPDEGEMGLHDFYRETGRKCKRPACHWHVDGGYALGHSWM